MTSGDPIKMAMVNIENRLPPRIKLEQLSNNLPALLPRLSVRIDCSCACSLQCFYFGKNF